MNNLYPTIKPYDIQEVSVTAPHKLYVEQCGNPDGLPVIFIHGGPGVGCSELDRCFFDPEKYRIILFDQRGCKRSTPLACLENNTTQDLIADIEVIRKHLQIESWVVFGGSWGSTLSLAYAQVHPEAVRALILRGIFLGTPQEFDWIFQEGMSRFYPEEYQTYKDFIAPEKQHDLINAYYELLTGDDEITRLAAAKAWAHWESHCITLKPDPDIIADFADNAHNALGNATLEAHYMAHNCFLEPNQLLNNISRIAHIPGVIVQGRYDILCLPQFAWQLHQAWPESEIYFTPDAGHGSREPSTAERLVYATNMFAEALTIS